jgi:hypothetical protein
LPAETIRFEPTITATGVMDVTWATGNPARSSSLLNVAPQRVLVPHVEVRITAETPASLNSAAMLRPMVFIVSTILATPVVL